MKISALILTHNEALHIAACLESLCEVEHICVVDSGSTDATLDIIRSLPRPIEIISRPFKSFSDQRNYALESAFAKDAWVLHLDADERLTLTLQREIATLSEEGAVAYNLPSMTFFRGRKIPRATSYPVYQTRLTRTGWFQFIEVGHGQKAPPELGPIPRLKSFYEHHPFDNGMSSWIARHDRYSTLEAEEWLTNSTRYTFAAALRDPVARRQWLKQISRRLPFVPSLTFLYLYLFKGGFLDGAEGRDYCRMRMIYEQMIILKVNEKRSGWPKSR